MVKWYCFKIYEHGNRARYTPMPYTSIYYVDPSKLYDTEDECRRRCEELNGKLPP